MTFAKERLYPSFVFDKYYVQKLFRTSTKLAEAFHAVSRFFEVHSELVSAINKEKKPVPSILFTINYVLIII